MEFSPHMANMARHDEQVASSTRMKLLLFTAEVWRFCANSAHLQAASAFSVSWEFNPGGFPSRMWTAPFPNSLVVLGNKWWGTPCTMFYYCYHYHHIIFYQESCHKDSSPRKIRLPAVSVVHPSLVHSFNDQGATQRQLQPAQPSKPPQFHLAVSTGIYIYIYTYIYILNVCMQISYSLLKLLFKRWCVLLYFVLSSICSSDI